MDKSHKKTQHDQILEAFAVHNGVLSPGDIMRLGIAQYNARIKELREKGYNIKNEYLGTTDGVKRTHFILISTPEEIKKPVSVSSIHEMARKIRVEKEGPQEQFSLPIY